MPTKVRVKYQTGQVRVRSYDTRSGSNINNYTLFSRDISGFTTGVNLPNYRELIRRRISATTNMNYQYRNLEEDLTAGFFSRLYSLDGGGNYKQWAEYAYKEYGPVFKRPPVSSSYPADSLADTSARLSLLGKIREAQTQFNAGTFFGELRETIHMLRRPAQALRKGIDDYVRTARKVARSYHGTSRNKALSGTWLEYQYGWKPLISDIDSAQNALSEAADSVTKVFLKSSGRQRSPGDPFSVNLAVNSVPIVGKFTTLREVSIRYKAAVSIWGDGINVGLARWGLDGSNFFPDVYNLIPYSFLVDYFSNLGKVIDAACLQHFVIDWGVKSTRRSASEICLSLKLQPGTIFTTNTERRYDIGTSMSTYTNEVVEGTRSGIAGTIETSFSDLRLQFPSSWRKWFNIAALSHQRRA